MQYAVFLVKYSCSAAVWPTYVRGGTAVVGALYVELSYQSACVRSTARSGVCPQRRPHAQQKMARDLEVERAVMKQCCRSQRFGEVQRCNTLLYVVVLLLSLIHI